MDGLPFEALQEPPVSMMGNVAVMGTCASTFSLGSVFWGNIAKAAYCAVTPSNYEYTDSSSLMMAGIGFMAGLMMANAVISAEQCQEDFDE